MEAITRKVPGCICITPDGNRRAWRRIQWLFQLFGRKSGAHERGLRTCREIIQAAFDAGVEHVVLWGASESNIQSRSSTEVYVLVDLLKNELRARICDAGKEMTRFRICGNWRDYIRDLELDELITQAEKATAKYSCTLTLLFCYSGETEVSEAYLSILSGETTPEVLRDLSPKERKELLREHLWTSHVPKVDLHIRTGVKRLFGRMVPNVSDPLLPMQTQDTVLYYTTRLWPHFRRRHLKRALAVWAKRQLNRGA